MSFEDAPTLVSVETGRSADAADHAALQTAWRTIGYTLDSDQVASDGTISPPVTWRRSDGGDLLSDLPRLGRASGEFEVRSTIGEGGMGVVRQAYQATLGRDVAIKSLRGEVDDEASVVALLREAWVTGSLEHPNVIPVHTLGVDDDGRPVFVMKRVQGVAWTDVIERPDHPIRGGDTRPVVQWHLEVFQQVCRAVHFAHAKGFIHRDLKPDNVMIGAFGEVYVLDWGIAVATDDAEHPHVPKARDIKAVAGTAHYMAPEMAAADGPTIGPVTDVYLLGATLYHALTGRAPHQGRSVVDVLVEAYMSPERQLGDEHSPELEYICQRAMSRDPAERFQSAEALRVAIATHVTHQAAERLTLEAIDRLEALEEALQGEGDMAAVERQWSEVQFTLQAALREWPQSPLARTTWDRARRAMAVFAVSRGEASLARAAMGDLVDAELADAIARLEAAQNEAEARIAALEQMQADLDLSQGTRVRARLAAFMAVAYTVLPLAKGYFERRGGAAFDYWAGLVIAIDFAVILAAGVWFFRRHLLSTRINRRIVGAVAWLAVVMIAMPLGMWSIGVPAEHTVAVLLLLFSLFVGTVAITIDPHLLGGALVYMLAFAGTAVWPEYRWEWLAAGNGLGILAVAVAWTPETRAPDALLARHPDLQRRAQEARAHAQAVKEELSRLLCTSQPQAERVATSPDTVDPVRPAT